MNKWERIHWGIKEGIMERLDKVSEGMRYFIWGVLIGMAVMYGVLQFVVKGADYYKGKFDGATEQSALIISKLVK